MSSTAKVVDIQAMADEESSDLEENKGSPCSKRLCAKLTRSRLCFGFKAVSDAMRWRKASSPVA
jgi:hypothetical protein